MCGGGDVNSNKLYTDKREENALLIHLYRERLHMNPLPRYIYKMGFYLILPWKLNEVSKNILNPFVKKNKKWKSVFAMYIHLCVTEKEMETKQLVA